jgi:hypothetical protein
VIAAAAELLRALRARGLVLQDEVAEAGAKHTDRPWYVSALLGVSGWFAGIFLLVFIGAIFTPTHAASAITVALLLFACAWGLFRLDPEGAFLSQLALVLSMAAQFAVLFGLAELFFHGSQRVAGLAFAALLLNAVLVLVMPNRLHRVLSAFFGCIAWAVAVRYGLWDTPDWSWRSNARKPALAAALAGWILVWGPVGVALFTLVRREAQWMAQRAQALWRPVGSGLVIGLALGTLLSQPFDTVLWIFDTARDQGGLALWPLLSAAAALAALAAAFALGNRGLLGLCIFAALLHLSHFYYVMGTSLLLKSITLLALGALLLVGARLLRGSGQ